MKTIEEGCLEHIHNTQGEFLHKDQSFKAGVEFAQRWIPVEEELPPCSDEDLLLKGIDYRDISGIVDIGYMHDSHNGKPYLSNFISLSGDLISITHWRPIDRS
jgi:hypothetical protein